MSKAPVLPPFGPAWAQRFPWLYGLAVGAFQGPMVAGFARYMWEVDQDVTAIVAVGWGIAATILARIGIKRTRRITRTFTHPLADVRKWPAALVLLGPISVLFLVFLAIIDDTRSPNGWQLAWIVQTVVAVVIFDVWEYRWIRRVKADPMIMAYGMPSYDTHPPVPAPSTHGPPPLPSTRDS